MDYTLTLYIMAMLANLVCGFLVVVMTYFTYASYLDSRDTDYTQATRDTCRYNARLTGIICLLSISVMVIGNFILAKWWVTTFANPVIINFTNGTMSAIVITLGCVLAIWLIKKVVED